MSDDSKDKVMPATYTQFVSAAMEFLAAKKNANVLILVESDFGFQMFRNVPSPIWGAGIAHAAQEEFDIIMRELRSRNVAVAQAIDETEEERIEQSMKRDKEKEN